MASSSPTTAMASAPGAAVSGGSTKMPGDPDDSTPRPSSLVEQIMPSDVCPYVFRVAIVKSPGSVTPGRATTTRSSTAKLEAPHTISRGSASPTSTRQKRIGFLNSVSSVIWATRPTTRGPVTGPGITTSSTSWPMRIRVSSISAAVAVNSGAPTRNTSSNQL
ncbi:Uncharacterised protein [Mycobacteroides abscessus subsp. abscessus]|nr:Uncharacterised protein [Mycobacteroides abscessus subsp. abscessus]